MSRGGRPRIILEGGLHRLYRVFVGFHALAHRVWRPGHAEYYLGSPAWRPRIEIEASTVGFLALVRWRAGPVCPRIRRAHLDGAVMRFWGRCLRREADGWWATG